MLDFAALFDASPNPYMVVDRALRYLAVNRAYAALFDTTPDALLGRGVFECFPGDPQSESVQQTVVRQSIERVFASGKPDAIALVAYAIGDEIRYWSASHTPLRDAHGNVYGVLQHTTDVTEIERMRADARQALSVDQLGVGVLARARQVQDKHDALLVHHDQLVSMFAQAPGFMAVLRGRDYVYELANAAYESLLGRSNLVGHSARRLLPELVEQGYFDLLDAVMNTGRPYVGRAMPATIRAPGQPPRELFVDFVFQPLFDAQGRAAGVFIQGADVTEREAAFAALRESEARFRTIADMIPQMIWSTQPDGFHDYYNRQWYEFTGVPEGSTDGEAWNGMFHPDDQARAWARWRHSLETGEPYEIEYRLRHRDGTYRWVLGRARPVRDRRGAILRWMGTCTEIQDLKRVQDELERSQAALREAGRRKDHFLAMLAHELRNPLAPVATAAKLLQIGGHDPQRVQQASSIIDRQVRLMTHLVNDLMDVSRVTRGLAALERRPMDLVASVRAAVEQAGPLLERRNHALQVVLPDAPVPMQGDPARVTQAVANLLNNAAKYTPPGGQVELELAVAGRWATLEVRDNGVGIDAALLPQVFELFTQAAATPERSEGGLGIGLALVKSLVEGHGGQIEAMSEGLGRGATFRLRLPLSEVLERVPG